MSVLQRKMFSNGGPANQPLQPYAQLISSYAQKGLSVDEALVELGDPNFPRSEVERIYASLGYSIDPSITDYQILPETSGIMIGDPDLNRTFDLTDVADEPVGATLDFEVPKVLDIDVPEITPLDDITDTTSVTEVSTDTLGPNEIELANGRRIDFSKDIDNINKGGYNSNYFLLFNSPDVKRGANVDIALNKFVRKNEPGLSRLGTVAGIEDRRGTVSAPADLRLGGIGALNLLVDFGREIGERILPPVVDFFAGPQKAEKTTDFLEGDLLEEGFFARFGLSPQAVDDILLRDFGGELSDLESETILETQEGSKINLDPEIEDEITSAAQEIISEDRERIEEAEQKATEEDAAVAAQEETLGAKKIPEVTYTFDADLAKQIADSPTFFETDAFRRFIRNVGTGLVKTGQLGSGLAAGATLAAEEERKIEEEKREAVLEAIKNQEDSGLDTSLLKILPEQDAVIAQQIKEFEGGQSSISFLQEAIKVFQDALDTGRSPTSFRGVIDKYGDQLQAFFGGQEEWDQLSATTKIERLIEVVRQKNLQAILGESGRTISDKDRQIVLSVFGDIKPGTPPLVAIKKLQESLEGLKSSQREKQSRILATQTYLLSPEFEGRGQLFLLPRIDVINRVLNTDVNAPVDIRNVESLSNLIDLYPTN